MIAAVADNNAIGRNGDLAFHISADLRRFKELTLGHTVIMGRKTFDSLPKGALPGRRNIVITRNPEWSAPDVETARSLAEAILKARDKGENEAFIIGGGLIYTHGIAEADRLYITRIYAEAEGADTFFPPYEDDWKIENEEEMLTDPKTGISYRFMTCIRR